jgi:hypothetical protein
MIQILPPFNTDNFTTRTCLSLTMLAVKRGPYPGSGGIRGPEKIINCYKNEIKISDMIIA